MKDNEGTANQKCKKPVIEQDGKLEFIPVHYSAIVKQRPD